MRRASSRVCVGPGAGAPLFGGGRISEEKMGMLAELVYGEAGIVAAQTLEVDLVTGDVTAFDFNNGTLSVKPL